jgi:hypothetical protein
MSPSSRLRRAPYKLSHLLDHRLQIYALAASAAGVSLLALAEPTEAKIVYTKTHKVIGTNGLYPLDLNHDGTIDFLIQQQGYPFSSSGHDGLGAKGAFGNAVQGSNLLASALNQGALIGPRQRFISSTGTFGAVMFNVVCTVDTGCSSEGKWTNVSNHYLGLRFRIHGKTHYGWARVSVTVMPQDHTITATLTGYAYETVPNQGLHAGQTHGADTLLTNSEAKSSESAGPSSGPTGRALQPASLGRLARGVQYVPLGREP